MVSPDDQVQVDLEPEVREQREEDPDGEESSEEAGDVPQRISGA